MPRLDKLAYQRNLTDYSEPEMSHLEFTFFVDPYNKNSSLVDSTRCSKANFCPPLCSTTLELEITYW